MQGNLFTREFEMLRDARGRKSFQPTPENRLLVSTLSARGLSHKAIVKFMGATDDTFCKDEKTLRKHFSRELEDGALIIECMAAQALVAKMMQGNMAAITRLLEETASKPPPPKTKPTEKPLGKKEQLERDAAKAPGGWGNLLNGRVN